MKDETVEWILKELCEHALENFLMLLCHWELTVLWLRQQAPCSVRALTQAVFCSISYLFSPAANALLAHDGAKV